MTDISQTPSSTLPVTPQKPFLNTNLDNKHGLFDKQIGRKAYVIVSIVTSLISGASIFSPDFSSIIGIFSYVIAIILFLWMCIVCIWRLNDIGQPWWHVFFFLIPIYNIFFGLSLVFTKGKRHRLLTKSNTGNNSPKCPSCAREFSSNTSTCPYCRVALT